MERSDEHTSRSVTRLIAAIDRHRRRYMNDALSEYGLRGPLFMFLLLLEAHPGQSQDNIAEQLNLDKSGVARAAQKLESLGYLSRSPMSDNRRMNCLYLTGEGTALLPTIHSLLSRWQESAMHGIEPRRQAELTEMLSLIRKNCAELR